MAGRPIRRLLNNGTITPMDGSDLYAKAQETLWNGAPRYYFHLGSLGGGTEIGDFMKQKVTYRKTPLGFYAFPLTIDVMASVAEAVRDWENQYPNTFRQFLTGGLFVLVEALQPASMYTNLKTSKAIRHDYPNNWEEVASARKKWQQEELLKVMGQQEWWDYFGSLIRKYSGHGQGTDRYVPAAPGQESVEWNKELVAKGLTSIVTSSGFPLHNSEQDQAVFLTRDSFREVSIHRVADLKQFVDLFTK
jgi:hypothetical protein